MINEKTDTGNVYRDSYKKGIDNLIAEQREKSYYKRKEFAKNILADPDKYREKLKCMLGWPLCCENEDENIIAKKIYIGKENDISIYRMVFKIKKVPFYGILFLREDGKKRPFVICQHGGNGTPELCSGFIGNNSENYNDMVERVLKYDVNVFAPQLLLWAKRFNLEETELESDEFTDRMRKQADAGLKQIGSSITALEIYFIQKSLDYFEKQSYVDKNKIGMTGLSYGGFYTFFASAIDKRIKSSLASSSFNSKFKYDWEDWVWFNSGNTFTDAEMALLIKPRKIYLAVGKQDDLFDIELARKEFEKLREYTDTEGWASFVEFEGMHEYIKDDNVLDSFINDLMN